MAARPTAADPAIKMCALRDQVESLAGQFKQVQAQRGMKRLAAAAQGELMEIVLNIDEWMGWVE